MPLLVLFKHSDFEEKICALISTYILILLLDEIVHNLTSLLIINSEIYTIILNNILISTMFLLIINNKTIINFIHKIKKYYSYKSKSFNITFLWLIVLYLLINFDLFFKTNAYINVIILIIALSSSIIYIFSLILNNENNSIKQYYNNLLLNNNGIKEDYNDYIIKKHNLNNFLLSLKNQKTAFINDSIDNYLKESNYANYHFVNNNDIPEEIYGYLISKMRQYKNIKFTIVANCKKHVKIDLNNQILYNEICNTIGIIIDNACEATKDIKQKNIFIKIFSKNQLINIEVINYFNNTINTSKIGKLFYTTKKYGSGIGIYSLKKNKFIDYKINIINNMFAIILKIKKP
jgi:hypothetical protein